MFKKIIDSFKKNKSSGGGCCEIEIVPVESKEKEETSQLNKEKKEIKNNNKCCG